VLCRDEATLHEEAELAHEAQALGLGAEAIRDPRTPRGSGGALADSGVACSRDSPSWLVPRAAAARTQERGRGVARDLGRREPR
jgi:hypothetical protein